MLTERDYKLIMKVMGGNIISFMPEIYAVWTRGCRDPARYLFAYIPNAIDNEGAKLVFDNIRLKFPRDINVIVTEKSIIVNGKSYNIESNDTPEYDVIQLFMELVKKHENLI
ncbi:MAG: hypothetical protein QXY52_01875 [Conexivisphaerales archaeon]